MPFSLGFWAAAGAGGGAASDYELIATTISTGSGTEITFSSIPSTYKHLQLRFTARNTDTNNYSLYFRLNGDTANNYTRHELIGTGSSVVSEGAGNQGRAAIGLLATTTTANAFTGGVLDIMEYTSTTNFKTMRMLSGGNYSLNRIMLSSALWQSATAVTSLTVGNNGAVNFASGSRFSLYGIKG